MPISAVVKHVTVDVNGSVYPNPSGEAKASGDFNADSSDENSIVHTTSEGLNSNSSCKPNRDKVILKAYASYKVSKFIEKKWPKYCGLSTGLNTAPKSQSSTVGSRSGHKSSNLVYSKKDPFVLYTYNTLGCTTRNFETKTG